MNNNGQNEEFGGLSREVAKMFGLNPARAMADYMAYNSQGQYGIVEDDFRCDADSFDKTGIVVMVQRNETTYKEM